MKGHFIAFEGANGVGKSTIIKKYMIDCALKVEKLF